MKIIKILFSKKIFVKVIPPKKYFRVIMIKKVVQGGQVTNSASNIANTD